MFDRLVSVVSNAAAAVYGKFTTFCIVLFAALLAFYIVNTVWKNIKGGMSDPLYTKSVQPVLISALVALSLLGMGVYLPRFVTTITFEPVADMTLMYAQSITGMNEEQINDQVTYTPIQMADTGFYRPQLRDKIVMLMKMTITQFQAYVKLGIAVMDASFSWRALMGVGALLKHIMMFFVGLFLTYEFLRLFMRFCFYFADIVVAMTYFAFFFPLSLTLFAFRDSDAPDWIKNMAKGLGVGRFKNVISAIIGLASAVLTYTVVMVLIAKFFGNPNMHTADLMNLITTGAVTAGDLSDDNLGAVTLMGMVVLAFVVNYISSLGPDITKMVLSAFDVSPETTISEGLATDTLKLTQNVVDKVKSVITGGENKSGGTK